MDESKLDLKTGRPVTHCDVTRARRGAPTPPTAGLPTSGDLRSAEWLGQRPATARRGVTRRQFLGNATAVAAGVAIVPASALGKDGHTAANDRIVVGAIGCGVRGRALIGSALRLQECQIVALCDVRRRRLLHLQEVTDNQYGAAVGGGCKTYHEYRDLLAREDIDAVILTPPDHWHGVIYADAIRAGKDIYGEKPITRTIAEGQVLRRLLKQYGTVFQTGTHSRSMARVRHACELARNGYLGKIHTIEVAVPSGREYPSIASCDPPEGFDYDRWTGPAPYVPFDSKRCEWLAMYMISHYCAGFITNWGVHFLDIAQWGCPEITTKPFTLEGKGQFPTSGMTDTCCRWNLMLSYDSGLKVHFTDESAHNSRHCRFIGDEGWVKVWWGSPGFEVSAPALRDVQFKPADVRLHVSPGEAWNGHIADFLRSVRNRQEPVAPFEQGHRATTIGNVSDITVRLDRELRWDWETETFDDEQANAMKSRPMREPYTI